MHDYLAVEVLHGRQLRRAQTGYVRNYALGIGVGAVILLFYVSLRAGS